MTVEAAMCLTLFLFMTVILMIPMKIMNTERKMQAALEAVGEDMAQYAYLTDQADSGLKGEAANTGQAGEYLLQAACYFAEKGAKIYTAEKIREKADTDAVVKISAAGSSILEDGITIDLIVEYEIRLPFPIFRMDTLKRQLRCCRRAWVGKSGDRGDEIRREEKGKMVYIGKDSIRYHESRTCHYLFNDISGVDFGRIGSMRNRSGSKYRPCSICGRNITGGTVYIMPSGESYHSDKSCRAITAYVQSVPVESVESLGPCSYCSGGSKNDD
ncbi:hypothetical protein [Clostridium sp. AM58-1XD]|uniref:hypothetical protein n=1 Tax=Clostridium sp. AM58-1XD TaxID=2292307 RepID=UPI0011C0D84E|nr:hypothetical protein [Clostridium sp. AM58-1XD]